jgi:hypothetical protein
MRHPRRARNIALGFVAYGIAAAPSAFLIPDGSIPQIWHALFFCSGLMSIIFGSYFALVQHLETRGQERRLRGKGIIARWKVDPLTWQKFLQLNHQASAEKGALLNQLTLVEEAPPEGLDVIVAEDGVQVGGDFQYVPFRGTPRVEYVGRLRNDHAACIELNLYYPSAKYSATRLALRFPCPSAQRMRPTRFWITTSVRSWRRARRRGSHSASPSCSGTSCWSCSSSAFSRSAAG